MIGDHYNQHDIGVIIMEVSVIRGLKIVFLKGSSTGFSQGIVLIFDECTSGSVKLSSLHRIYGVEPDMAMFGKPWATVMLSMQSSGDGGDGGGTIILYQQHFWTERIGP